jgi:cytoskeleton protein RodZ
VVSERRAFGDRARRQRERRGITLEAIAQATKVPASLFAGLERGDCSRWPGGVYSRAYVRAYAEFIGLDPNEAVEDFTAAFGDTAWPEGTAGPAPRRIRTAGTFRLTMDDQPEVRQARTVRRAAFAVADLIIALALAGGAYLTLETGVWTTLGIALGYHSSVRMVSDEPFLVWLAGRFRTAPPAAEEEVTVTDPASTTA